MVTSGEDGSVKLWDPRTTSVQRHFKHGAAVNDVVVHPNQGDLISCDQTGCIKLWDLKENSCTGMWANEEEIAIHTISVASDGSMLVAGNNEVSCSYAVVEKCMKRSESLCLGCASGGKTEYLTILQLGILDKY